MSRPCAAPPPAHGPRADRALEPELAATAPSGAATTFSACSTTSCDVAAARKRPAYGFAGRLADAVLHDVEASLPAFTRGAGRAAVHLLRDGKPICGAPAHLCVRTERAVSCKTCALLAPSEAR